MFADAFGHTGTELPLFWVRTFHRKKWEHDSFAFDARFAGLPGVAFRTAEREFCKVTTRESD